MTRVIFLLLLSSIAFQSQSQTWQNFLQKRFKSYGIWADSISIQPSDTTLNKTAKSIAIKGTALYIADGAKWTAVSGGSVDSLTYATWKRLYKVNDSMKVVNDVRYLSYQWADRFDDSVNLTGFTNQFTLSHLPTSNLQVYSNGTLLTKNRNYTLSDSTITIIDTAQRNVPYSGGFSRAGTTAAFITRYPFYGIGVNSIIKVSGATNTALNGTYLITGESSVAQGKQYTYTTTTSGTIASETTAKIILFTPVAKKSIITATYNYTTAQPTIIRYDTANTYNIVFYGNSLFQGVGANGGGNVENQLQAMMPSVPVNIVNLGTGGINTETLESQISEVLSPNLSTSFKKNIILVSEIVNAYAGGGKNSYQLYYDYKQLCLAIKALNASYKVVATTVLDTKTYIPDSVRVNVNNFIIADNSFYDSLVNTTANAYIGVAGAAHNQDYFDAAGLHLYPDGYYEWAKAMYPIVMGLCNMTVQDISRVPIQTSNNVTFNTTGNYPPASTRTMTLGSDRLTRLNVVTNGQIRGYWDSTGGFVVNQALTGIANGVNIITAFSGTSGSDVYNALRIAPTFSNGAGSGVVRNYLTVLDGSTEVFTVNNSQVSSLYKINAVNSYLNLGHLNLTAAAVNTSTYTANSVQFYGPSINTSASSAIGGTLTELRYNADNTIKHSFRLSNTEYFAIGASNQVYGGYGDNLVLNGSTTLGSSTTTGLVFKSTGGVANQIFKDASDDNNIVYQTRAAGKHRFSVGTEKFSIDVDSVKSLIPFRASALVKNGGTAAQILAADGSVITAGTNITISGGTISSSGGGGGGSVSLAAIGSTPNANGATLTGTVLNLEPASASFGGVVTTGTQTFAGAKSFSSAVEIPTTATNGLLLLNGGGLSGTPQAQIQLGYAGKTYQSWIATEHSATSSLNKMNFYTGTGTANGTFPTHAVLGLTVSNGSISTPGDISLGGTFAPVGSSGVGSQYSLVAIGGSTTGFSGTNDNGYTVSYDFKGALYSGSFGTAVGARMSMFKENSWNSNTTNASLIFSTNNGTLSERMRIASTGNVAIGTTTTTGLLNVGTSAQFQVSSTGVTTTPSINGGIAANDDITIQGTTNATRTTSYVNLQPSGGLVGIGTTTPTAKLHLAAGSITTGQNAFKITGTSAATTSAPQTFMQVDATPTASGGGFDYAGLLFNVASGYTGTGTSWGMRFINSSAGTGTDYLTGVGNIGVEGIAGGTTTGVNVGLKSRVSGGNNNIGTLSFAITAKNGATNVGVLGLGLNTGTTPTQVGGYFGLQSTTPTLTSAALIADNGSTTSPIFLARDNGTTVFTIADGGNVTSTASLIMSGSTSVIRLKGYTVATLPAGTQGDIAFVTDALTPTFLGTAVGGGAVVAKVFHNGTTWITQ